MAPPIVQIIEDEPLHAQLLDRCLQQARYDTRVAYDGAIGLESVRRVHPSVVLLDLMLPEMSGQEVCRLMRSSCETRDIPIIMISALDSEEDRVAGIDMGADDYIGKPFSPREVVSRVGAILRRTKVRPAPRVAAADGSLIVEAHCLIVSFHGKQLTVSAPELSLLQSFSNQPGQIVAPDTLHRLVEEDDPAVRGEEVERLIRTLRRKLENAQSGSIEILPRIGYRYIASPR